MRRRPLRVRWLSLLAGALAACSDGAGPAPTDPAPPPNGRSFPGFDTSIYPGDAAMRAWRRPGSPYEWSGYYLPAPCHRDTTWVGKRQALTAMGWGLAVIYVGQQTWERVPGVAQRWVMLGEHGVESALGAGIGAVTCSRTLLSASQGAAEAADAIARTTAEGFPFGTVVFLDLEYMTTIPAVMRDYYRAWIAAVLAEGRFRPGIYVHTRNAADVFADARAVYAAAGRDGHPEFWVASTTGFSLEREPSDVGHAFASVWQGRLDVTERWNGVSIRIDANVARHRSPSLPSPVVAAR